MGRALVGEAPSTTSAALGRNYGEYHPTPRLIMARDAHIRAARGPGARQRQQCRLSVFHSVSTCGFCPDALALASRRILAASRRQMQRNRRFALDLRYSQLAANASIARQAASAPWDWSVPASSDHGKPAQMFHPIDSITTLLWCPWVRPAPCLLWLGAS